MGKSEKLISFIIPAYNAEKTITKAIDSILNQKESMLEFEIIIVNDGSKDKTKEVMNKYQKNKKIKYFEKKENTGIADTRNFGVSKAKGNYIIFVDSDDYLSDHLLKNIALYINQDIDLIKWNPICTYNGNEMKRSENIKFNHVTGEEGFNLLFGKDDFIDCLWNYAIKKEIMLEFPECEYHEDFAIMPLIILNAKTMASMGTYEYYYVQNENSLMNNNNQKKDMRRLEDKLKHYDNFVKKVPELNIQEITKENLLIYVTNSLLASFDKMNHENIKWFRDELKKRKIAKNIKIRNIKQLIKRMILEVIF